VGRHGVDYYLLEPHPTHGDGPGGAGLFARTRQCLRAEPRRRGLGHGFLLGYRGARDHQAEPDSANDGGACFTLTVNGTAYVGGATVTFGGAALITVTLPCGATAAS